ncbi:MAG: enoyl-CoA hydratase [Rhodospirillales bacterium]|nr:enoyl-CoA hydratase [Rhodospirillales bacterium]
MSDLLLVGRVGRVMTLTINNPEFMNALGPDIYAPALIAMKEAEENPEIGAIVLSGADGVFCAGGNLNRLKGNREKPKSVQKDGMQLLNGWVRAIRACPVPVIAAVEGAAAGAGFSIALACDLIVSSEEAVFSMSYVKVGLNPDGGGTAFLSRALPHQLAAEIVLEGGKVAPARLHAAGVINKLTPKGEAVDKAIAWATKLANGPREATARAKGLLEAGYGTVTNHLDLEVDAFVEALHHDEAGEGISAFLEKRKPNYHKN